MQKTIQDFNGDVFCPLCAEKMRLPFNEYTGFHDCKKRKVCSHMLNNPLTVQRPTNKLFGGEGTQCFADKMSPDYKKEGPHPFSEKYFCQPQSSAPNPVSEKGKNHSLYGIGVAIFPWLIQLTKHSFPISFFEQSVYSKKTMVFQSPTTHLSSLSILNQIQLLLL